MIVADANLIVYLTWRSEHSAMAESVWLQDPSWVAPPLWLSELRSALGQGIRHGRCTLAEAIAVIDRARRALNDPARPVSSRAVLELSRDSKCSTYDCEYVALAKALGVPLVTSDRAVLRAFPGTAISPRDFVRQ